jgi:hypothetical protein
MRPLLVASVLAAVLISPVLAVGEDPSAEEQARLEAQIARELAQGAPAASPPPAPQPATGANPLARLLLMPDLSAIASFAAVHDGYDVGARSPRAGPQGPSAKLTFLFQELELGLQAVIDPYARADVFVSFAPEEVAVEEAYLTTLGLPAGLQLRAGRFFSPFGRLNTTHPHTWDFLDAPLARGRLLALETLSGPGLDLAWLAPLPWFAELHLAAQSTAPFEGEERLTGTARLSQFFALSEATTAGLGLSAARRDEGTGTFRDLGGVDVLVKYRPPAGRAYARLEGELYARRFRGLAAPPDGGDGWGAWAQLFWRQDAWLGYGVRWERAPAGGDAGPGTEQRWSVVGDWFLTEFQRVGLQVARSARPGGEEGWEAVLHAEFVLGAHGAHPF